MKQETLEEAAERYYIDNIFCDGITDFEHDIAIRCYIAGAKWQAEKMYNDEDIYSLLDFIRNNAVETDEGWQINKIVYTNEELFEYFKNK
jgi:hypothetical protein